MAGSMTRWILRGLGVLFGMIALVAAGLWSVSNRAIQRRYEVTPEPVTISADSATIERGRHLATAIGKCVDCHGEDLGGQIMDMGPVGSFRAANLTRGKGGLAPAWTDADFVRAIRHGVAPDGRGLVFMPSGAYQGFSEADLAAVIAYVKSAAPVDRELAPTSVGPIGRLIIAREPAKLIGAAQVDHHAPLTQAVLPGPTAEYGGYLTVAGGCTFCHGPNLRGGLEEGPPGTPPSADLTQAGQLGQWSQADFQKALRQGVRPDGSAINPFMPWRLTRLMTDEEISAVWVYLKTLQ